MRQTQVLELVHGGDWACAAGDRPALVRVCRMLARALDPDQRTRVRAIERLARRNLDRATVEWTKLGRDLRS